MKPFLLLQVRPEDAASDDEYEAFLQFTGLDPNQLSRLRIEKGDIPRIELDNYSGIILGGGPYNVSDPQDKKTKEQKACERWLFDLLDRVIETDFPFLGTCSGIGILTVHQGGKVSRKYGETLSNYKITLTETGKKDRLLKGVEDSFEAFIGHKEACEELPKHARRLVTSTACPVQMFKIKDNVYTTQFHTELDGYFLGRRATIYQNYGYFPPEDLQIIIDKALKTNIRYPMKILRNFVKTYQR